MSCLLALVLMSLIKVNTPMQLGTFQNLTAEPHFLKTLRQILAEEPFETLFLLETTNNTCISPNDVWKYLKVPLLIASSNGPEDKLKDRFSCKQLAVVCLSAQLDHQLLNILAANLQHMRQTRIILHIADTRSTPSLLMSLQTFLSVQRMVNAIAIFYNFYTSYTLYRYHPFPNDHWVALILDKTQPIFLYHHTNMQGKTFITLPGLMVPYTLIYEDAAGDQHLSGYVSYLMIAFAEKHNFTWKYVHPFTEGNSFTVSNSIINVMDGNSDFAIALCPTSHRPDIFYYYMSYPIDTMDWLITMPCPQPVAYSEIYTLVVTIEVIGILVVLDLLFSMLETVIEHTLYKRSAAFNLANVLINTNIVRGIFGLTIYIRCGQIFSLKILYIFLFLLGLFVNNMYSAYFQTLFTSPPLEQKILTFDDMRRKHLKIMFGREGFQVVKEALGPDFNTTFENIVLIEDTEIFERHRAEFDTTYAYSLPAALWSIYDQRQRTFQRKMFCLAPTLKFFDRLLLSIPLAENSYLTEPLNKLILRAIETGLLKHWFTTTLVDIWETGEFSPNTNSSSEHFHDIRVEDLKVPWYLLLCGLGVSGLVFAMEFCMHKLATRSRCERRKRKY